MVVDKARLVQFIWQAERSHERWLRGATSPPARGEARPQAARAT